MSFVPLDPQYVIGTASLNDENIQDQIIAYTKEDHEYVPVKCIVGVHTKVNQKGHIYLHPSKSLNSHGTAIIDEKMAQIILGCFIKNENGGFEFVELSYRWKLDIKTSICSHTFTIE